ncbi:MAG: DUF1565 domain-containing protein [Planctomycetes bacterium]|nr:DUF1565 domain-containing protein [Planctomycetota bacterium]
MNATRHTCSRRWIGLLAGALVVSGGLVTPSAFAGPRVIWVDNTAAHSEETGTSANPYETITTALGVVRRGQTVRVRVGLYTAAKGEVFPLAVGSDVRIEGAEVLAGGGGRMRVVRGPDGRLCSWPIVFGGAPVIIGAGALPRNVAMTLDDRSRLSKVIVYTEERSGTSPVGILCQTAGQASIRNNRFRGKGHAGVTILDEASPQIWDNKFEDSRMTWGVTAHGSGRPDIYGNHFSTHAGVDVTQASRAQIRGNRFVATTYGIRIQNDSNPYVYKNEFTGHRNAGIVLIDGAPTAVIARNTFSRNGRVDEASGDFPEFPHGGVHINHDAWPDLGGGPHGGEGGNVFSGNIKWDVVNRSTRDIFALHNTWSHTRAMVDRKDIYDDDEWGMWGAVTY